MLSYLSICKKNLADIGVYLWRIMLEIMSNEKLQKNIVINNQKFGTTQDGIYIIKTILYARYI